jgi:hypothetical protein
MNAFSELIKELGTTAEQSLGKEKAEETTEFHEVFMGRDDRMVGMYSVTTSTFVTGMLAYRTLLAEVAPEMVEQVDAHMRKLAEEKGND